MCEYTLTFYHVQNDILKTNFVVLGQSPFEFEIIKISNHTINDVKA